MADDGKIYEFKSLSTLTVLARWALFSMCAVEAASFASSIFELKLLLAIQSHSFADHDALIAAAHASDQRQQLIAIVQLLVLLAAGVLTLTWIYRANGNAHALSSQTMTFTPGWAVGWNFIPVLSLWKPYQAMAEIWQVSEEPRRGQTMMLSPSAPLLPWWWGFWLTTNIAAQLSFRLSTWAGDGADMLIWSNLIGMVSNLTDIPACILLVLIMRRIAQMQEQEGYGIADRVFS